MKKLLGVLVTLCALAFSARINAQSCVNYYTGSCPLPTFPASCGPFVWEGFSGPICGLPVGSVCCNPDGVPLNQTCVAPRRGCVTPNTAAETCPGCNKPAGGGPINLSSGNTYIIESDISVPGLGGGLKLTRTWNSMFPAVQNTFPTMFGINWRSTYEERLIFYSSDLLLKYARGDGSVWSFGLIATSPNNQYETVAPGNDTTTITQGSTALTLLSKDGAKRTFDLNSGLLLSIIDRNGNTTQLSYDSQNRLTTVTDPAARHLTFTYVSGSSNLVGTASSDVGISYSYSYDSQGRLTQVTKPDNTTINFAYDSNNRITSVTDSQGKILESHSYDALGRGLTSSRANGVDALTVTYPH